jgi:hypothetical protein
VPGRLSRLFGSQRRTDARELLGSGVVTGKSVLAPNGNSMRAGECLFFGALVSLKRRTVQYEFSRRSELQRMVWIDSSRHRQSKLTFGAAVPFGSHVNTVICKSLNAPGTLGFGTNTCVMVA